MILPGKESPERMIAKDLNNLSEADPLWHKIANGYSKQVCFRGINYHQILSDRQMAKEWFNSQLQYWGKGGAKVLNPFLDSIKDDCDIFRNDFMIKTKKYIHD